MREIAKKGETFASLLNIHGGDIRVVPTHLVSHYFLILVNFHIPFAEIETNMQRRFLYREIT